MRYWFLMQFMMLCATLLAQVGTNGASRSEAGRPVVIKNLTISADTITLAGVQNKGMMVNASIPGPVLEFTEGDLAVIRVTNTMNVETSVHWHGLILPNIFDGVPYLTTPPIKPGKTFEYRIPINQSGTYWYHSHTMLQEQKGVYGAIVIHPKTRKQEYDKELVVVLSDWTDMKSENIMRNLKRGNEWFQVKKGTAVPFSRVIARGAVGAQLKFWRDRMEGADIADVYYPAFLANGDSSIHYDNLKPGEKVRLRLVNASASTYFWMDFGDSNPNIISADGIDVQPVEANRFLFAIAETYDLIIEIKTNGTGFTATAQDGSGYARVNLGPGHNHSRIMPRPDKVAMMQDMAKMDMKMGAPALSASEAKSNPQYLMQKYGMDGHGGHSGHGGMRHNGGATDTAMMDGHHGHGGMGHDMHKPDTATMDGHQGHHQMPDTTHSMSGLDHTMHQPDTATMNGHQHHHTSGDQVVNPPMNMNPMLPASEFTYADRQKLFNYDFLQAPSSTGFASDLPMNEMHLTLTGNMNRYVWSLNGKPLSETDMIALKKGEISRIHMHNLTMMHHPMHLHGHYFRVLNNNGDRSPLKHTVNVPAMQNITIEFMNEEEGDWFFHCHVLYHMMGGMARIYSYGTPRDTLLADYPADHIIKEANDWFTWGTIHLGSNFTEVEITGSNLRNELTFSLEGGYVFDVETELNYAYYINDWWKPYVGMNVEYPDSNFTAQHEVSALVGIKYFTPYMFNLDVSIDHQLRPWVRIDRELMLFPRFILEGEFEYRAAPVLNAWNDDDVDSEDEMRWLVRGAYMLSRNVHLQVNYHNRYRWGAGISLLL